MIVSSYGPGGIIGLGDLCFLGLALAFASSAQPSESLQKTYIIVGGGVKYIIVVGNNRAERREREDELIIVEERLIERGATDGDVVPSYHHVVCC